MSLLVLLPAAHHHRPQKVRVVLHTCLIADSHARITMGGAREFAMSITYYPPGELISRIPVSPSTRSRRLDTYFQIQYKWPD